VIHRICIAVVTALAFAGVALMPSAASTARVPADPDARPCVSHKEWRTINHTVHPWRPRAVDKFTETTGVPVTAGLFDGYYGFRWNVAPACSPGLSATFGYDPTTKRLRALAWVSTDVAVPPPAQDPTPTQTPSSPPPRPTPTPTSSSTPAR
jgi:hypothetical protein